MVGKSGMIRRGSSLGVLLPLALEFWDYSLNSLDPYEIGAQSSQKIWLKCPDKVGHIWESKPYSFFRTKRISCPYCTLKRLHEDNSLVVRYPKLAAEFYTEKNGIDASLVIGNYSAKKYWWKCSENHEWEASLSNRARLNSGCPACSGRIPHAKNNLAVLYPDVAKELNVSKTGKEAHEFVGGSDIHVWWTCSAKGHEWKTAISTRTKLGSGCPYCTNQKINDENSLLALFPEIAAEFDESQNGMTANEIGAGALKWVWWKCSKGHTWESAVSNRTSQNLGCPKCSARSTSKIENLFRKEFIESGYFYKVETHPFRIKTSMDKRKFFEVDILCYLDNLKVAVEYDGSYYHKDKADQDIEKTKKLIELGYTVVRIREQSSGIALPLLDFENPNFIQVSHVYNARNKNIKSTVQDVLNWISFVEQSSR